MSDDTFEGALEGVYWACAEAFQQHEQHAVVVGSAPRSSICLVDDRCDALTDLAGESIERAFRPEDAEWWLARGPDDLLDWSSESCDASVRDYIASALREEAWLRLFPDHSVTIVHPSKTREPA